MFASARRLSDVLAPESAIATLPADCRRSGRPFSGFHMASNTIGIGLVGLSAKDCWAARAHVPALKTLPNYQIRALATSSRQSAEESAKKYDVPLFFDDARQLAMRPEVDLVVVAVKVPYHRELVTAALVAGKMVYCEWPLGNGLAEAEEMAGLAKAKGIAAFVGLQGHASPAVRYVRDLVASGYIGELVSTTMVASAGAWGATVEPRMVYALDRSLGVSMLTVQFGHAVDAFCWCLGEFRDLSATLATRFPQPVRTDNGETVTKTIDDQIAVSGVLENGAVASIHYRSGLSRVNNFLWEINGSKGDLVITGDLGRLQYGEFRIRGGQGASKELTDLPIPSSYELVAAGAPKDMPYTLAQTYARLSSDIAGKTRDVPRFGDAVVRHRMIDAVEQAAWSGQKKSYSTKHAFD